MIFFISYSKHIQTLDQEDPAADGVLSDCLS